MALPWSGMGVVYTDLLLTPRKEAVTGENSCDSWRYYVPLPQDLKFYPQTSTVIDVDIKIGRRIFAVFDYDNINGRLHHEYFETDGYIGSCLQLVIVNKSKNKIPLPFTGPEFLSFVRSGSELGKYQFHL